MFKIFSVKIQFLLILLLSFIIFFPSLFTFYTNDDFFLLKISRADSIGDFINFFNFSKGPGGLAMYRPLTTQVFYFIGQSIYNLNPLFLHILAFLFFFGVVFLVYKLTYALTKNETIATLSLFFYAVSSSHFGHLYYLATFQELGLGLFFLLSTLFYIKFVNSGNLPFLLTSLLTFVFALLSKEMAVVLPLIFFLMYLYVNFAKWKVISLKKFAISLTPFLIILIFYLYQHFFVYGLATGESYIWDFSFSKVINTGFWYLVWSLNMPEMLVDFVGPGFKINPNLFKFWSNEIVPIFILFGLLISFLIIFVLKAYKGFKRKDLYFFLFCAAWFVLTLLPVVFLPLHKFSFYLTLPLFGVVVGISYLVHYAKIGALLFKLFIAIYLLLSLFSLNLTKKTHWITRGSDVAKRVYGFVNQNEEKLVGKTIIFYDAPEDGDLPWSPSETLKVILSDNNFFDVFYEGEISAIYIKKNELKEQVKVRSRMFLGY